jgi:hypothetical protein
MHLIGCGGGGGGGGGCGVRRPSFMVDHSAIRNRMVQWSTYLYDMHGELIW